MAAARFIISAALPDQFPKEGDPEVAFLGRSNVGKSSLLNALVGAEGLGKKGLAFTSSRPGCTQFVNFYQVDGGFRFVDLPGYGFAKVPKEKTKEWKALIESYLKDREILPLCLIFLISGRGWMEKDMELGDWLKHKERPNIVRVTKVNKLK